MTVVGTLLAIFAVALLIIGALAWSRRLPGNKYIGVRVTEVRKSKENWDTAHQFAGPLWVAAGVALAVASVPPFSGISWLLIITVIGVIAAVYFVGLGASLATRAAGVMGREDSQEGGCCGGTPEQTPSPKEEMPCEITGDCDPGACSGAGICGGHDIDIAALRRAAKSADG
ncbi:SdpI/YhfL protein family [Corynebacterium mustelae]|uniref:SdpI/YhfL protein family n=1 Tax=Corynebacterium mustelae TaxID=571915 RepID=A0A0G3H887_9CORY|nr:SdpI family protein [Corynebacterium mustelae]AKK07347.1 SdpI/YhfL protein family [Corynebacterium mustelae]